MPLVLVPIKKVNVIVVIVVAAVLFRHAIVGSFPSVKSACISITWRIKRMNTSSVQRTPIKMLNDENVSCEGGCEYNYIVSQYSDPSQQILRVVHVLCSIPCALTH